LLIVAGLALGCVALVSPRHGAALLSAPSRLFTVGPGWPRLNPLELIVCISVYAILASGGWALWRERKTISSAQIASVVGAGICAALLACPVLDGEYFRRLVLMSAVPAAIVLAHVMTRRATAGTSAWPALLIAGLCLLSVAAGLTRGEVSRGIMPMVITAEGAQELRSLRPRIEDPKRTVVLARKGLMWWAGFLMRVPVREDRVSLEDVAKYERVLVLEDKTVQGRDDGQPRMPPPPPRHGPESGRPGRPEGGPHGPREKAERILGGEPGRLGSLIYEGQDYRLYEVRSTRTAIIPH
jgi:hypothetical protein